MDLQGFARTRRFELSPWEAATEIEIYQCYEDGRGMSARTIQNPRCILAKKFVSVFVL